VWSPLAAADFACATTVRTSMALAGVSHQITPVARTRTTMPMATGPNRKFDSGLSLRLMRKSSSRGFLWIHKSDRAQEPVFFRQGQLRCPRLSRSAIGIKSESP